MPNLTPDQRAQFAMTPQVSGFPGEYTMLQIQVAAGVEIVIRQLYTASVSQIVSVEVVGSARITRSEGVAPFSEFKPAGYVLKSTIDTGSTTTPPTAEAFRPAAAAQVINVIPADGLVVRAGQFLVIQGTGVGVSWTSVTIVFEERVVTREN